MALQVALGEGRELALIKPAEANIGGILIVKSAVTGVLQAFEHLETIRQHPAYVEEQLVCAARHASYRL